MIYLIITKEYLLKSNFDYIQIKVYSYIVMYVHCRFIMFVNMFKVEKLKINENYLFLSILIQIISIYI